MIAVLVLLAGVEAGSSTSPDLSWLAPFGAAAPFAALCFVQMARAQTKQDAQEEGHRAEVAELRREIADLNRAALQREQQLVAGLGPRIFDAAQLFKEGADAAVREPASPAPANERVEHLAHAVEELVELMAARPDDGRTQPDDGTR